MRGFPGKQMSENVPNASLIIGIKKKPNEIHYGYCQCGCGEPAPIATKTSAERGCVKGGPVRFVYGHYPRTQPSGKNSKLWKPGIKTRKKDGRVFLKVEGHHRADRYGNVFRSIVLAEKALGKNLPAGAQVHHFDEDKGNDHRNLVICENQTYHHLLHQRKRAYDNCGNINWLKCQFCGQYDDPENLYIRPGINSGHHRACENAYGRKWRKAKKMRG